MNARRRRWRQVLGLLVGAALFLALALAEMASGYSPMEAAMKETDASNWVIAILTPIALLLLAVPLVGALQHATSRVPVPDRETLWTEELRRVDKALAERDVSGALRAWREAYVAALASRRWEGMLAVGDSYLRIGELAGNRHAWEPKARESYLIALFRARQQGAIGGLVGTAEAFAALGDHEVVRQCVRLAERLANERGDDVGRQHVRRFLESLTTRADAASQPAL